MIKATPALTYALTSAFIPVQQKKLMVEEILKRLDLDPRLARLVKLLTEKEKMSLLPEILDELPGVWAEEKGIEVFEIDSAVDLTEEEKPVSREPWRRSGKSPSVLISGLTRRSSAGWS